MPKFRAKRLDLYEHTKKWFTTFLPVKFTLLFILKNLIEHQQIKNYGKTNSNKNWICLLCGDRQQV